MLSKHEKYETRNEDTLLITPVKFGPSLEPSPAASGPEPAPLFELHQGNCLEQLAHLKANSVQVIVTSSPYYGMRNYHGQPVSWPSVEYAPVPGAIPFVIPSMECDLGLELTPEAFIAHLVLIYREARRVLRDDGTMWLNLADTFWGGKGRSGFAKADADREGEAKGNDKEEAPKHRREQGKEMRPQDGYHPYLKPKDLILMPQRLALALQADGWFVRADIPWLKDNGMPSSANDRPAIYHETFIMLSKRANYYYDYHAVRLPAKAASLKRLKRGRGADQKYSTDEYGQQVHTLHKYKPHNPNQAMTPAQHLRHRRTTDWWFTALELMIQETAERLSWLERFLPSAQENKARVTEKDKQKSRGKAAANGYGGLLCLPLAEADYDGGGEADNGDGDDSNHDQHDSYNENESENPSDHSDDRGGLGLGPVALYCNPANSKTAHYATFPAELVAPCVISSTAPMACEHCGAPWRRHLEQTKSDWQHRKKKGQPSRLGLHSASQHGVGNFKLREVLGESWRPGCQCQGNTGADRCVVLDPFAGSGTVLEVAVQEGRYGIGIELNPEYCALIRKRVGEAQPPFAFAFEDVQTQGGPHFKAEVEVEVEVEPELAQSTQASLFHFEQGELPSC